MKKYIFALWLVLASAGFVFAGPPCIPPIPESGSPTYLTIDLTGITDTNIPYMQAAGAGFGDSPLWATDASTVTLKAATGQPAVLSLSADAAEDNSDKWRIQGADGGNVTLETYQSGAWVAVATWTNAGGYTVTGALAGTTLDTGQGANELYDMDQDVKTTSSPSFVAVTEGVNAVPNATDNLSFFAATTSAELAGVLSDETGTLKAVFSDSPTFTTQITTPAITAPAASLVVKPTTDAVNAVQIQKADGTNILNVDTTNSRIGIGLADPDYDVEIKSHDNTAFSIIGKDATTTPVVTMGECADKSGSICCKLTNSTKARLQAKGDSFVTDNFGVGTSSPDAKLHAELDDATTAAAKEVARLSLTSTGTPAAGIGPALQFEVETAAGAPGNMEVVGQIDGIAIDVATPTAEDGAIVMKTMKAGAAATEDLRISDYGMTLTDGTDSSIVKHVQEPGLGGRLTFGLDETARTMVICDAGDVGTDFGLSVVTDPTIRIFKADAVQSAYLTHNTLSLFSGSLMITGSNGNFITYGPMSFMSYADLASGNAITYTSNANIELTDTDGEQSWLYVEPKINQSATAGYNGLKIKVTETALGSAAAATDSLSNNLILAGTSADPDMFKVNNSGVVSSNGNKVTEHVEAATDTLSTTQCYGGLINNYGQAGNVILTLPAAANGMSFTVILGTTAAFYFRIDPNANDSVFLDGTSGGDGKYVGLAAATVGNAITFQSFQTGAGAYDWYASTISGSWLSE